MRPILTFADVSVAALALGAQGMPVFPCDPASKRPLVATGFKAATTDRATITTWWKQWPGAMIGIPTGEPSGLLVLDIDYDESKGLDGFAALASMEAAHGPLPKTRTQRTPRGGEHRLFSWPGFKIKNSASKLGAGLDIRGDGGYVIAAPSVNADGVPYEWTRDGEPVAAPHWLLVFLDGPKPGAGAQAGATARKAQGGRASYVAAALANECGNVARAANGQRNAALNRAAYNLGQLVGADAIGRGTVESALVDAASACGLVADDGEEAVRRTIKSGLDAGVAQPRDMPEPTRRAGTRAGSSGVVRSDLFAFDRTEDGIALAFAETHKDELRFCHDAGKWYLWTGTRWQKDETKFAFNWARKICRDLNTTSDETLAKASTAAAVERFAQADRAFAVTSAIWDADPFLLGTPAGVVNLRTGILRPAERTDCITRQAAVAPDPKAARPLWTRFLDEATVGDAGLQRFLQQVAGYCLSGDVRELVRPAVVADATNEYFTEQDSVRQWVEECCETGGRNICDTTAALFASWSAYALANGEKPGTTKWFSQILHRHGYEPVAETPGHRKKRGFMRIGVKTVDTSDQWQNRMEAENEAPF